MNKFTKTLAVVALVAVAAFGVRAPQAKAATMDELQAMIASLQAQLAAMSGGSSSACYTHTVTLKVGSTGSQVMAMQGVIGATADGKFGPMTKSKVMAFQSAHGLTADGVVGAMTGAALHAAGCSTTGNTNTGSTGSTALQGGAGSVQEYKLLSSPSNNEKVGEGSNNVKVYGFSVEADDNSDLNVKAIKVNLAQGTANHDFRKYADNVSVWFNGNKVAQADAADFDSDNGYAQTLSLTSNAVIKAGEKENFYVAVSGADNIDTPDIGDTWTVDVDSVRWMDAQGGLISEDPTLATRTFSFESFETANDLEFNVTTASDNPDTQVVAVDDVNDTNNVVLLKGKFKTTGGEMRIQDVPMTTTAATGSESDIAKNFTLIVDGETVDSIDASDCDTGACTFDGADFTVGADETVDFEIQADLNDTGGSFADGDYLSASLSSTNVGNIDVQDENGDDVTNLTGAANGKAQYFFVKYPQISVVSSSIVANDNGSSAPSTATATMKLKIVAKGGTIYLNGDDESTNTKEFFTIAADAGGNASTTVSSYTFTPSGTYTVTNNGSDNEYYTVNEGDTMYVDIQAIVSQATSGGAVLAGMKGTAILFGTDSTSDTTRSANTLNYTALTDMLKTGRNVTLTK
jgi:peptidoglycan hydrolase-like protein with peptidoglycan-binding domain